MQTIQKTKTEEIYEQSEQPQVQVEARPDVQVAQTLHSAIDEMADNMDVTNFKCAHPNCGLVHTHDTNKHRASDDFDMSENEAAEMEANPNCHCGLNELARDPDVSDAPSPSQANDMAPIPEQMSRHLNSAF